MDSSITSDDEQQPQGSCPLCYRRDPIQPPVCTPCRSWLPARIGDLRILFEQLAEPEPNAPDRPDWVALDWNSGDWRPAKNKPPVPLTRAGWLVHAHNLPAAPIPGTPSGVARHMPPDSRPPLALGPVDVTSHAHPGSLAPHARGILGLDEDQVGRLPLATVLEDWAREWAKQRREHVFEANVPALTRWLADRADWACDEFEGIESFAQDVREWWGYLRGLLGLSTRPEYKDGVACPNPKCQQWTLYQEIGSDWVECGNCHKLLSQGEFYDAVQEQFGEAYAKTVAMVAGALPAPAPPTALTVMDIPIGDSLPTSGVNSRT